MRAVVAEGASGRTAADKAWLSEVYRGRGWLQEQIEVIQYGITDLLTQAGPPTSLDDAVAGSDRPVLLIAAGTVADEQHVAERLRALNPDTVTVWTVPTAGHTGGLSTDPDAWEDQVVRFLDDALGPGGRTSGPDGP